MLSFIIDFEGDFLLCSAIIPCLLSSNRYFNENVCFSNNFLFSKSLMEFRLFRIFNSLVFDDIIFSRIVTINKVFSNY